MMEVHTRVGAAFIGAVTILTIGMTLLNIIA
jgi:hypothetical protein